MDIVIFGISGDLAAKKLIPSLVSLHDQGKLPQDTRLIGFSRSVKEFSDLPFPYTHIAGEYDSPEAYMRLKELLRDGNRHLFYLALPPQAHRGVLQSLHQQQIVTKDDIEGQSIILIEKPFGLGLEDAQSLMALLQEYFRADQYLKVDHYAGKKELRDMHSVDSTAIKQAVFEIAETLTVEDRAGFYATTGALRDVGQNHLLLMLSSCFKGLGSRAAVLEQLKPAEDKDQYVFGTYEGYDAIETFFSIPATLAIGQGQHVDIVLRSGKALSENRSSITLIYNDGHKQETILTGGIGAYENILADAIEGNTSTFLSDEEIIAAWKFIEAVEIIKQKIPVVTYPKGSTFDFFTQKNPAL